MPLWPVQLSKSSKSISDSSTFCLCLIWTGGWSFRYRAPLCCWIDWSAGEGPPVRIESRGPSCSEADLGLHCGETSHDAPPLSTSPYTYQLHILSLQSCYIVSLSGSGAAAEWMLMSYCSHLHQRLQHPRLQLQRQLALTLHLTASVTVNIRSVYRCATSISFTVSSGSHHLRVSDFKKKSLPLLSQWVEKMAL